MLLSTENEQSRFVLSATPQAEESLPGFMIRLAQRARLSDAVELAKMAGLRQPGSCLVSDDLAGLAFLSGVPEGMLRSASYAPTDTKRHHRFLGGILKREQLDIRHRRACPECLQENRYHRCSWDLALGACCPDHSRLLLNACWLCLRKLSWRDFHLDICSGCGASHTHAPVVNVEDCDAMATRDLLDLAAGRDAAWLPPTLKNATRSDLLDLALVSGLMMTKGHGPHRYRSVLKTVPTSIVKAATAGVRCIRDWPLSMTGIIEQMIKTRDPRKPLAGAQKTFGKFYSWIIELPEGILREAVLDITRQVICQDPLARGRMHRSALIGLGLDDESTVCLQEATEMLASSGAHIKRLAQAGVLKTLTVGGVRGIPLLLERRGINDLAAKLARHLSLNEAAERLCISKDRMMELIKAGLIKPDHRAMEDGFGVWAIDSDVVDQLLRALEAKCKPSPEETTMEFNAAVEALRRRGTDLPDVLRMVLQGKLPPVCILPEAAGLKRLAFSQREVRVQCRMLEAGGGCLSRQAAAEILGFKWEVIRHLIQVGLMQPDGDKLAVKEIYRFKRDVVSASELARSIGVSPLTLLSWAKKTGIIPVSGPNIDGGRQVFFRKTPALSNLSDLIKRKKSQVKHLTTLVS